MAFEITDVYPAQSYSMTVVSALFTVFATIVWIHIVYHLFASAKEERVEMGLATKRWLSLNLVASVLSIWLYVVQRIVMYSSYEPSVAYCHWMYFVVFGLYVLSKGGSHGFFLRRLGDTLQGTAIRYSGKFLMAISGIKACLLCLLLGIAAPAALSVEPVTFTQINNMGGCAGRFNAWYLAFVVCSILLDLFWTTLVNWLLVKKLLCLVTMAFRVNFSSSTTKHIETSPRISDIHNMTCVKQFHATSQPNNNLIHVCSKLVILNAISCITSITFLILLYFSGQTLQLDIAVNLTMLWLNFKFAERWFVRCQCHRFEAFVFPLLKTCAFIGDCKSICCHCCEGRGGEISEDNEQKQTETKPEVHVRDQSEDSSEVSDAAGTVQVDVTSLESDDHMVCCSCCCAKKSRNVYFLASCEYQRYKEEITNMPL